MRECICEKSEAEDPKDPKGSLCKSCGFWITALGYKGTPPPEPEVDILSRAWVDRAYRETAGTLKAQKGKDSKDEHVMTVQYLRDVLEENLALYGSHEELRRRHTLITRVLARLRRFFRTLDNGVACSRCIMTRDELIAVEKKLGEEVWKVPDTNADIQLGDVTCMNQAQYRGFLALLEEKTGKRMEHLRCGHFEVSLNMRLALLRSGFVCLDCLMKQLGGEYPK